MHDLWSFIAADNIDAADRVAERLKRAFDLIAVNPRSGRLRPDMGPGIRSFVVGKYVVFYRITLDGIDVGRVMHGARNIVPDDVWPSFVPSTGET
jgi:toxin ParE1/3/4